MAEVTLVEFLKRRNPVPSGNVIDRRGVGPVESERLRLEHEAAQAAGTAPPYGAIDANSRGGQNYYTEQRERGARTQADVAAAGGGVGLNRLQGLPSAPIGLATFLTRRPSQPLPPDSDTAVPRALAANEAHWAVLDARRQVNVGQPAVVSSTSTGRSNQQIANDRAKRLRERRKNQGQRFDASLARKMNRVF